MNTTTTRPENMDDILRRIAKLLAIAEDDRADPNEAAAAAGMAERIMRKFQLEHSDIISKSLKAGDDLATEDVSASAKTNGTRVKVIPPWAMYLATRINKLTDTEVRYCTMPNGDAGMRFFGYSADVKVAAWMFNYLVATSLRLCNEFKRTPEYAIHGRRAVNSYRLGVTTGINKSISDLIRAKQAEKASTCTALVVVKQQAIVAKWGDFKYREGKAKNIANGNAYSQGVADGKKVDVRCNAVTSNVTESRARLN